MYEGYCKIQARGKAECLNGILLLAWISFDTTCWMSCRISCCDETRFLLKASFPSFPSVLSLVPLPHLHPDPILQQAPAEVIFNFHFKKKPLAALCTSPFQILCHIRPTWRTAAVVVEFWQLWTADSCARHCSAWP